MTPETFDKWRVVPRVLVLMMAWADLGRNSLVYNTF